MGIQLQESKCLKPHSYFLLFWLYLLQNQEEDPDLTFKNGIMIMDLDLTMIMDLVLDHTMVMDLDLDLTMTMDLALTIVHSTAIHHTHQDLIRIIEMFPTNDCSFRFY